MLFVLKSSKQDFARMSNRLRVQAAVSEFLHTWTCGGKASLHLDTSEGGCTVSFTAHFGHWGALLLPTPPPAPASPIQCHRGRADRERNRQPAAAHQAAQQAAATSISSSPPVTSTIATASAVNPSSSAPVLHPAICLAREGWGERCELLELWGSPWGSPHPNTPVWWGG